MTEDNRPRFIDGLTLAALPTAVGCSRMLVRYALATVGLKPLIEPAELVMSELVTNAVKSTGVVDNEPRWTELHDLALVKIRLVGTRTSLFVEVWDRDETLPTVQAPTLDQENGRGLFIVEATCKRWDAFRANGGGKVVWGELEIPPETFTSAGLPKRQRTPGPRRAPEVKQNPELLRRVRDGLKDL
jgi:anti-sigma regulatory factor (Ser/Thr protein kinase)